MSRRGFGKTDCETNTFRLERFCRRRSNGAHGEARSNAVSIAFGSFASRLANFIVLCAMSFVCWSSEISRAQESDLKRAAYAGAVEYCRGNVERPMTLDPDKRILCFDGALSKGQDVSLAKDLEQNGLFVVRGWGGDVQSTMDLADVLQDRHATVVVYEYCLLACAGFLIFASEKTFVLKNSLVAWRYAIDPLWCPALVPAKDEGPKRLEIAPCSGAPPEFQQGHKRFQDFSRDFYAARGADPLAEWPPQSVFVRKVLGRKFKGTGTLPDYYWTWNPRYAARAIKTKIIYEAYPQTQDEIDAIAAQISLHTPVIYDP
jgi:hypothetical protein